MQSYNLVILLTPGVLTRPWCLFEIVAAYKAGSTLLPVLLDQPGAKFEFPTESFYDKLRSGATIDDQVTNFLRKEGYELFELELALRQAFKRIAVQFSPMKQAKIRRAELEDLLSKCQVHSPSPPPPSQASGTCFSAR